MSVGKTENSRGRLTCIAVSSTSTDAVMLAVIRRSSTKLGSGMTSITTTATTARGTARVRSVVKRNPLAEPPAPARAATARGAAGDTATCPPGGTTAARPGGAFRLRVRFLRRDGSIRDAASAVPGRMTYDTAAPAIESASSEPGTEAARWCTSTSERAVGLRR